MKGYEETLFVRLRVFSCGFVEHSYIADDHRALVMLSRSEASLVDK
jgi:hypothetical protein